MTEKADQRIAPPKILVVCLGNDDRGDDGVGAMMANILGARLPPDVPLLARSGAVLSLIEDWTGFDVVVCIDAMAPMGSPGRIHRIDITTAELPLEMSTTSSHAFGLAETIALSRTLQLAPQQFIIYAVEGRCFEMGASMSPDVAAAVGEMSNRVVSEVRNLRQRLVGDLCPNESTAGTENY